MNTPLVAYVGRFVQQIAAKLDARFPFTLSLKILALVIALTWYSLLPVRLASVSDPDLGWHLRSGEWIMQHHQLPRTDTFSYTGIGKPWVAYSWTYGVLIYELAKNFDLLGIAAYTLLAWVTIVVCVFVLARGQGGGFWTSAALTTAFGLVLQRVVSPRPGTVTMILFIVLFHILLRERHKDYTRRVWVIPAIIWIWANVHVQFVYGLFILGLFCIEPILNWVFVGREEGCKLSARLWLVLVVSALATLLNPYGFGPYQVLIDFVHQPLLARFVSETSAMAFVLPLHYLVLLLTMAAAFVLGRREPIKPLWVILLVWSAISAFKMERDIWVVATIAVAMIASQNQELGPRPKESSRLWLYGSVGVLIVVFAMLERVPTNKDLLAIIVNRFPVGAVAYVHEKHLTGPIFNDYTWGGFLIYALPELPVSIDGRTNVHGQDEVGMSLATWDLRPGWDQNPQLNKANLVFGPFDKALTNYLRKDPHFKVVFDDGVCVLFQRVAPGKPGLVQESKTSGEEGKADKS